jgi:hypothetical protein
MTHLLRLYRATAGDAGRHPVEVPNDAKICTRWFSRGACQKAVDTHRPMLNRATIPSADAPSVG